MVGHRADISGFFLLDGFQHFLGVESFMQNHGPAEIDDAEGERASGVEVDRRRQDRPIVRAESFFNRVVDAVKDKSPLRRQAAFGKAGGSRREQDGERIVFVDKHAGLVRALAVEQTAIS